MPTKISDMSSLAPAEGTDEFEISRPSGPTTGLLTLDNVKTFLDLGYLIWAEEYVSGTAAVASSAATWNTRVLNTEKINTISGASVASNQITLPAGTYKLEARGIIWRNNSAQMRLRNVTDGATLASGLSHFGDAGSTHEGTQACHLVAYFTLAGTKALEIQHYTQTVDNFGIAVSSGEVETYLYVVVQRLA